MNSIGYSTGSRIFEISVIPQSGHLPGAGLAYLRMHRTDVHVGGSARPARVDEAARAESARIGGGSASRLERPDSSSGISAIHRDYLASDVIGAAAGEEHCERRDVLRRAHIRIGLNERFSQRPSPRLPHLAVELGQNESGSDTVHLDIVPAPFGG